MSVVLGVSMGASAVRIARPESLGPQSAGSTAAFEYRVVHALRGAVEQLAAESIGVLVAQSGPGDEVSATAVAYRDEQQAGAIEQAMAKQQLHNYRLVPEMQATLHALRQSGDLLDYATVAFYDLGSSGLTVSVVDLDSGSIVAAQRTEDISGNQIDILIRDNQLARMSMTPDSVDARQFATRCRVAKEQLSTSGAVALPGDGGLILLSREAFDSIIGVPIDNSIRFVRDVLSRSPKRVEALVLIGGGSRIPLVQTRVGSVLGLPVVLPSEPESVSAKGAAMLAVPTESSRMTTAPILRGPGNSRNSGSAAPSRGTPNGGARNGTAPATGTMAFSGAPPPSVGPPWNASGPGQGDQNNEHDGTARRRKIRGAALAAIGLGVIAAVGISLGAGGSQAPEVPVSTPKPEATRTTAPKTTTIAPTTTTLPPVSAVPVPTQAAQPQPTTARRNPNPVPAKPAPAPAPAPAPPALVIPGLPPIVLPVLPPLPVLPRIPGL